MCMMWESGILGEVTARGNDWASRVYDFFEFERLAYIYKVPNTKIRSV